jgi:DNA-binding response OmpR family regulator
MMKTEQSRSSGSAHSASPDAKRVLIVDDDESTAVLLAKFVDNAGYRAIPVARFQDGARIMRRLPPDLLITDIRLGAFNGLQLLIGATPPVSAIVITGFDDAVLEATARQHGADYLLKPLDFDALMEVVRHRLEHDRGCFSHANRTRTMNTARDRDVALTWAGGRAATTSPGRA